MRRRSAASLGRIGDEKAIQQLIHLFNDDDKTMREHALNYLGDMGNKAVNYLLEYCDSKNERIRAGCIAALGRIASQNQTDIIMDALSNALDDDEDIVKWRAADAFCYIGIQHSVANKNLIGLLSDDSLKVRQNAIEALGYMGNEDAICHIIRAKQDDDPSIRDYADKAWEEIEKRINEGRL